MCLQTTTKIVSAAQDIAWTEYVQAWAAIVGIPAAIWGFIVLLRRDKQKDEMIRQLGQQTTQLVTQTNELTRHTDQLNGQLSHLAAINQNLAEASAAILQDTEEKQRLTKLNHRNAIQPNIQLGARSLVSTDLTHRIHLRNMGSKAQGIRYEWISTALGTLSGPTVLESRGLGSIEFQSTALYGAMGALTAFAIRISYHDAEGNEYEQELRSTGASLHMTPASFVREA